jgi:hypothetical protein
VYFFDISREFTGEPFREGELDRFNCRRHWERMQLNRNLEQSF